MTQMGGPSSQSAYAPSYQDSFGEYASQMGPQGASQGYADSLPGSAAYSYATQANHASQVQAEVPPATYIGSLDCLCSGACGLTCLQVIDHQP